MKLPCSMKPILFCICVVAVVSPLIFGCTSLWQTIQPFSSTCAADNEVATSERESVNRAALQFIQDGLSPDSSTAYASFTPDAKKDVSPEKFASIFQDRIKPMGPFKNFRAAHTYVAKVTGGSQAQRVVCGRLSTPQGWVALTATPGPAEAYVVVEGDTVNNTAVFVVWLIPEQANWSVQYFYYATSEMVGKSYGDLQKMAEMESEKQHDFNALLLYAAALQLADRGPFFQLGIRPEIEKTLGQIKRPDILQGQPPFIWRLGASTFKVLNVGPIGVGGKIYLSIDQEIEPWSEDKEADKKNHDLMAVFARTYPEYRDGFAGLVVRAHERGGNRTFGTVDENQKQPN